VDEWKQFTTLRARIAVGLTPAAGATEVFGIAELNVDTAADMGTRTVLLSGMKTGEVRFPSAKDAAEAESWRALTAKLLPSQPVTIALDRVLAYVNASNGHHNDAKISMEPPPILVSTQPAVLVMIDGEPILVDVEKTTLQHVVNTNWDLFFDKQSSRYFLRKDKSWLVAKGLKEAWSPVTKLPGDFARLPDTPEYTGIKTTAASPQAPPVVTLVLVVNKPSELIVIKGQPAFQPIAGTQLMLVTNTDTDLFFHTTERSFYLLTSGRWFATADLKSQKWNAATTSLPPDFSAIPTDHPKAHVLAAVPGTRQAELAVLEASIPQTAVVDRKTATAAVDYVGDPKFEAIPGTAVSYAVNTPSDVLKVGDNYYLCLQGVWFVSKASTGPWETADKIPQEVTTIPPTSPKYHVTHVTIYESTPTTVTYGYTAAYTGMVIAYGVAMWGTGYYYSPYYGYGPYGRPIYWPPPYHTYGASAWYNPATGSYARGSSVYGPYGGYGRAAAYNPRTGGYAWGQRAWGPYGAAASGGFYNPRTGAWGGSYHGANAYQSWGQAAIGQGDRWAKGGYYSDSRGSIAGARTSQGGKIIAADNGDNRGFVARSGSGNVYAGKDGNVYRRSGDGWHVNDGGGWNPVSQDRVNAARQARVNDAQVRSTQARANAQSRSSDYATNRSRQVNSDTLQGLNRDSSARQLGNRNAARQGSTQRGYSRPQRSYSGRRGGRR
jgi:hypothetical protein